MTRATATATGPVVSRLVGFSVAPLLALLAPLLVLPLVAHVVDRAQWAALGVGQALGATVGIVVAYGWPMVGPVELARAQPHRVPQIFYESLVSRGLLWLVSLPPLAGLSWAASRDHLALSLATAAATATMGLSSQWVAVGLGRAGAVVLTEHLPRLVVMVLAGVAIHQGASVFLYPVAIAVSSLVGVALFCGLALRPARAEGPLRQVLRTRVTTQWSASATAVAASAYSAGALFLVGVGASVGQTAQMASADRLYKVGLSAIVITSSALQAWVVPPDRALMAARRRAALLAHLALGLIGAAVFTVTARWVARLLFGDSLDFGLATSLGFGLAFLFVSLGTSLSQHVLVPDGRVRDALYASVAGAVVGVPLLIGLAAARGAAGGAIGLAASELVVLVVLAWRVVAPATAGVDEDAA